MSKLSKEEKEIEAAFKQGKITPVKNRKEIARYQSYAQSQSLLVNQSVPKKYSSKNSLTVFLSPNELEQITQEAHMKGVTVEFFAEHIIRSFALMLSFSTPTAQRKPVKKSKKTISSSPQAPVLSKKKSAPSSSQRNRT
ncbi:hypothetical protein NIES37_44680 [Tolypothrix tenuis PCC 7101]|uniref:Uncharacterized protein n=1 Tax=Tolypothrix tenuis PCC 7101 TaxID=231146 RepID=A0A1Z4N437_9CYAN|nr:hypothetical protein [Aulosira sp. FACHB-113]BAZ00476.1 hypothetical protein NIES37_44680 [Tolypothrix tenuis PCC 7101]BAZ75602.1 hypothetical protein NIES50_41900 [Aulosira laxa NIES-50]